MTQTTPKNHVTIRGRLAFIQLDLDHETFIDLNDLPRIQNYSWRAVRHGRCWYAKTTVGPKNHQVDLSMHRIIAKTPYGLVCHHRNRNSLDNRRANLHNMTKDGHNTLHAGNNLLVKYKPQPIQPNPPSSTLEGGICPK